MRKLAIFSLALVLLASTAVAMPEGWSRRNGMMMNEGVGQQADAIERGGSFYLDLDAKALVLYPWQDGSTDVLYMQPVGLEYDGPMVENGYGWKIPLKNHIYGATSLQLLDLQSVKVPDALEDFLGNGVALLYVGMPVAGIPQGEWIPKRIAFSGMVDDCTFTIQQPLTQQEIDDGNSRPDWVDYSVAISHASKVGNHGFKKYMTGKIAHIPRPIAIGRKNGDITGWAYGEWREVSHGVFDKVFYRDAQFDTDMVRRGIGNPQTIAVSADIGVITIGETSDAVVDRIIANIHAVSATEAVQSYHIYNAITTVVTTSFHFGFYTDSVSSPDAVGEDIFLPDSNVPDATPPQWWSINSITNPIVTNGTDIWVASDVRAATRKWDAGGTREADDIGNVSSPWPDPWEGAIPIARQYSHYLTTAPSASPPVTTNVTTVPSTIPKGTDIEITATITDGDNVTSKWEWYIGADPGEGAGNEENMPGGSSPWSVSVTGIDSSGLPYGSNSFSVRGFSSDGWGAVDTAISVVNYAAPENLSGVGADGSVVLEWDATDDADDYFITWGTAVDGGTGLPTGGGIINVGDVLTYTHTGRVNGTTYYYAVAGNAGIHGGTYSPAIAVVAGVPAAGDTSGQNLGIGLEL